MITEYLGYLFFIFSFEIDGLNEKMILKRPGSLSSQINIVKLSIYYKHICL